MRALLTVAPGRATAVEESARLLALVRPALEAVGAEVVDWLPEPLPWLVWLQTRDIAAPAGMPTVDMVIGFELPDAVKQNAAWWVDLRRHPVRFLGDLWSVVDKRGPVARKPIDIPEQPRLADYASMGAFACQVSFDSALMRGGAVIRPADVMEGVRAFAHRFEALFVAPHPLEPRGPWVRAVLDAVDSALPSPWPTYELLARVRDVCTVTSSVGVEAAYFGVRTTWLSTPIAYGPPVRELGERGLWRHLLARARAA